MFSDHQVSHSSQILDWLYLGGENNAKNEKELKIRTKISYILNVSSEVPLYFQGEFIHKKIDILDDLDFDIFTLFEETNSFIKEAKNNQKNILVHCI